METYTLLTELFKLPKNIRGENVVLTLQKVMEATPENRVQPNQAP